METIKYIIKRLLLAVFILLGVSVIIYALARMMPVDFIDQQYESAVLQGTMSQDDVDRIKELFGLNMPDAYLYMKPGDGSEFDGVRFEKNTKESVYNDSVQSGLMPFAEWYEGTFTSGERQMHFNKADRVSFTTPDGVQISCVLNGRSLQFTSSNRSLYPNYTFNIQNDDGVRSVELDSVWTCRTDNSDITLTIDRDNIKYNEDYIEAAGLADRSFQTHSNYGGTIEIGKVTSRSFTSSSSESDDGVLVMVEEFVAEETGIYTVLPSEDYNLYDIRDIKVQLLDNYGAITKEFEIDATYRKATFWDKAGSVLGSYFNWLGNIFKGDLGTSFKYKRPVSKVIIENMGISFAIAFIATILQFLISIPLGIKAAVNQYGVTDYTVTILTMIGISLPTFFLGAIVIRVFAVGLHWFDVGGLNSANLPVNPPFFLKLGDTLWHMVLPMFVLVVLSIGSLMRYTRTNTLEALNADYVRTARAKGLSEKTVIYKHAFRNTLVPLVTLLAGILPSLFSGAMITETVFSIPGIGKKAYDALMVADVPFIMGYNMFLAILTVLGTLLSDLMYAVVDPRVKIGK